MKALLAGLGLFLGAVGVLLGLGGLAGVWWLHHQLQNPIMETADVLADIGEDAQAHAQAVVTDIETLRDALRDLQNQDFDGVQGRWGIGEGEVARIRDLQAEANRMISQLQGWGGIADAAFTALERVIGVLESAIAVFRDDSVSLEHVQDTIDAGLEDLAFAAALVEKLPAQLAGLEHPDPGTDVFQALSALLEPVDRCLAGIQVHARSISVDTAALTAQIRSWEKQLRGFMRLTAVLVTVLLVWQTAAQASLIAFSKQYGFLRST